MSRNHHHRSHASHAKTEKRKRFPRYANVTELGNAQRLALAHGADLRFFGKQWHVWDGRRFAPDQSGEANRRAKETVQGILAEAATFSADDERDKWIRHHNQSESNRAINSMLALAQSERPIAATAGQFDSNPLLLNVKNGTLNLETGSLKPHNRRNLITMLAPVEFDPKATAPRWEKFLREVMDEDDEKIGFLRRAVGYSLTGNVSEHVFFLLHGTGANGKSTFIEVLRTLFGDYARQSDFSTFLATKGSPGTIRNDLARLHGARFVTAVESDAGRRLAENVVKHMTGGDTVAARFLYKEHFEFTPQFKLWLATNNRPRIIGTDEAIWRRIRLVPFTVTIPKESRDEKLPRKLKSELSGVLNWALAGLAAYREQGLAEPKTVNTAGKDYRRREDALGRFLHECTVKKEGKVGAEKLYQSYKEWIEKAGEFQLKQRDFNDALENRGYTKLPRGHSGIFWKGIRLA